MNPSVGKITYFKGKIRSKYIPVIKLMNRRTGELENLGQLYIINGKQREAVEKLVAGDIGAVIKLKSTETSDTLHDPNIKFHLSPYNSLHHVLEK